MPGFIGGSSSGSSSSGTISFPSEFIDPVTKLRVSTPQSLIDSDFEYGLQPTKWETVELINNTPSFFSKGGDTTIPSIISMITNAGTREITVTTGLDHNLSVGTPINVTGTKSITADGAYIIASIPSTQAFTYLCKDNQATTVSINDLYTSVITGEFFQGSQVRVSDVNGIQTDGEAISTLTVTMDSTHGFLTNTPFYFLNLNSTISQEFQAANTAAKSFDSSNSATAQTFDGSNTQSQLQIDFSNNAIVGGVTSSISSISTVNNTITVSHGTENFSGKQLGTPLYYSAVAASGYFNTNPRGVVFLNSTTSLGTTTSTFSVSDVPNGVTIPITVSMTGTFQLANQARVFAGNNQNSLTDSAITIINDTPVYFDGSNDGYNQTNNRISTQTSYSGSLVNVTADFGAGNLDYYQGAMVKYTTTGSAATGLTANATYFIDTFFQQGATSAYSFTLKNLPGSAGTTIATISGGTGTQKFTKIGLSIDKDIIHAKNNGFALNDMIRYTYPSNGNFLTVDSQDQKNYYFITTVYDSHNIQVARSVALSATGGTMYQATVGGTLYQFHRFTAAGANTITVTGTGTVDVMLVGGGGGAGGSLTGGGGGGAVIVATSVAVSPQTYSLTVGAGGAGGTGGQAVDSGGARGGSTTAFGITATGGAGSPNRNAANWAAGVNYQQGANGAGGSSDGGGQISTGSSGVAPTLPNGITGTVYAGFRGGNGGGAGPNYPGGGGAGANAAGENLSTANRGGGNGGAGININFDGNNYYWAGGGGGSSWCWGNGAGGLVPGGAGGTGGGGGGTSNYGNSSAGGGSAINSGGSGFGYTSLNCDPGSGAQAGGFGGANSGGGGGAGQHSAGTGGDGGSGIIYIRYKV